MGKRVEKLKEVIQQTLSGSIPHIIIRSSGSLRIFNADKTLIYEGYKPEQEHLKGLICRVEDTGDLIIIAPCLSKFYNLGERKENDDRYYRLLQDNTSTFHFTEKVD
jgi:hypothetical protein